MRQPGNKFIDATGDSPMHSKLGIEAMPPRLDARMAGSIGHMHISRGVRAPKSEKRYTTPRSDFRFALQPVTVARPRWVCTSFHES